MITKGEKAYKLFYIFTSIFLFAAGCIGSFVFVFYWLSSGQSMPVVYLILPVFFLIGGFFFRYLARKI